MLDMNMFLNLVLLSLTYIIGVGITFLVAKLMGKKFLDTNKSRGYWKDVAYSSKLNDYYKQY